MLLIIKKEILNFQKHLLIDSWTLLSTILNYFFLEGPPPEHKHLMNLPETFFTQTCAQDSRAAAAMKVHNDIQITAMTILVRDLKIKPRRSSALQTLGKEKSKFYEVLIKPDSLFNNYYQMFFC